MSWRTSRGTILLRNTGRVLGLNRLLVAAAGNKNYEDRFQSAMIAAIRAGDTVWDVGANVGLYSTLFSGLAGPSGHVVAWEPSRLNLSRLREAVSGLANVMVQPVALGQHDGTVELQQGADELGASSRIRDGRGTPQLSGWQLVPLACGDELVSSGAVPRPNVLKIDTEGFELDVLLGLRRTLQQPSLRAVCVEMHFAILRERHLPSAASDIERLLTASGFAVAWPDSSHIVATRAN